MNNDNYGRTEEVSKKYNAEDMIGTRRTMKNGHEAVIVEWRKCGDIDVEFPKLGISRTKTRYSDFIKGNISPYYAPGRDSEEKERRVGLEAVQPGGTCRIIEYFGSNNITVKFLNTETILKNRKFRDFEHYLIRNPDAPKNKSIEGDKTGAYKKMKCRVIAIVIGWRSDDDIDVRFSDGEIVYAQNWKTFLAGEIQHPTKPFAVRNQDREGTRVKTNNGLWGTVTSYKSFSDVTVTFDDGVERTGLKWNNVIKGEFSHPDIVSVHRMSIQEFAVLYYLKNYGFHKINCGEWKDKGFENLELDLFQDDTGIAIEVDGGFHKLEKIQKNELLKNKKCKEIGITLYRLRDPSLPKIEDSSSIDIILDRNKQILRGFIDCGEELKEILRKGNIDFNDTDIDYIRDKDLIMDEYADTYIDYYRKERLGEKVYHKTTNQYMTIIQYYGSKNITVQFDDSEIVRNILYSNFKNATVQHPSTSTAALATQRQKIYQMKNGMLVDLFCYHSYYDCDVMFLFDGVIRRGVSFNRIKNGDLDHPHRSFDSLSHIGEKNTNMRGIEMIILDYRTSKDIDVLFLNDSKVRYGVAYWNFLTGKIEHPNNARPKRSKKRRNSKSESIESIVNEAS